MLRIIQQLTEAEWFRDLMTAMEAAEVPVAAWLSSRNPGLAMSKFLARAMSVWDQYLADLEDSLFLQSAQGNGLFKFGRSQYQLQRYPEHTQLARFVLTSAAGSPDQSVAAGELTAGLRGGLQEWTSTEDLTLRGGRRAVVIFEATAAGTAHNVAPSSPVQLLTTLVGVSVSNPPVGQATALGAGAAGLLLYAAQAGVTVETIDPSAPSQPVTFLPNLMTKRVQISLGTDGAGVINSTAADVADALATTTPQVLQLLFWAKPLSTGAGLMSVTAAPLALKWNNSYIERAGADAEDPESYRRRCITRFMALGGWAGDGAPPSPVATDEALEFWARSAPSGFERSPVTGVKVLSNFLAGAPSGKDITVLVWGPAGALTADEVTAVDGNFYNGRKFSTGSDLHTVTVTNISQPIAGTVEVPVASGYTEDQVRAAIALRIAGYQSTTTAIYPGVVLEPSIISARIADSLPDGKITKVVLSQPTLPVPYAWDEYPVLDPQFLTINFV